MSIPIFINYSLLYTFIAKIIISLGGDLNELVGYEKKKEIVLEDYEFFICNLKTLTPTEYRIYELYLDGKSAKEIMEITEIKENTLKYHNKNIYNKLGVSSRKQLLRFASLKQHQDSKGESIKWHLQID